MRLINFLTSLQHSSAQTPSLAPRRGWDTCDTAALREWKWLQSALPDAESRGPSPHIWSSTYKS